MMETVEGGGGHERIRWISEEQIDRHLWVLISLSSLWKNPLLSIPSQINAGTGLQYIINTALRYLGIFFLPAQFFFFF